MQSLVIWSLSNTVQLRIASAHKDLGSVTCCDSLHVQLMYQDTIQDLGTISGCDITHFQSVLKKAIEQSKVESFMNSLFFSTDCMGQALVDIRVDNQTLCYAVVAVDTVQSWVSQLELLHVVMEENEKEQKSRGTGCCG